MPREHVTYGLGGYDPKKPNNNVIERVVIPDDPEDAKREDAKAVLKKQLAAGANPTAKELGDAVALLVLEQL